MLPGKGDEKAQRVQNLATKPLTPWVQSCGPMWYTDRPLKLSSEPHVFTYSHIIKKIKQQQQKKKTKKKILRPRKPELLSCWAEKAKRKKVARLYPNDPVGQALTSQQTALHGTRVPRQGTEQVLKFTHCTCIQQMVFLISEFVRRKKKKIDN